MARHVRGQTAASARRARALAADARVAAAESKSRLHRVVRPGPEDGAGAALRRIDARWSWTHRPDVCRGLCHHGPTGEDPSHAPGAPSRRAATQSAGGEPAWG